MLFAGVAWSVKPARAGMILDEKKRTVAYVCKPRASGDDPGRVHLAPFHIM